MKRFALLALLPACMDTGGQNPPVANMANPASVHCVGHGGTHFTGAGGVGMCHLPDGRSVNEWDHYRSHGHAHGHSHSH